VKVERALSEDGFNVGEPEPEASAEAKGWDGPSGDRLKNGAFRHDEVFSDLRRGHERLANTGVGRDRKGFGDSSGGGTSHGYDLSLW
jgi:hypothetical protein